MQLLKTTCLCKAAFFSNILNKTIMQQIECRVIDIRHQRREQCVLHTAIRALSEAAWMTEHTEGRRRK